MITIFIKFIKACINFICTFVLQALATTAILFILKWVGGNMEIGSVAYGNVILQEFLGQIPSLGSLFSSWFQWLSFTGIHTTQLQVTLFVEISFILLSTVCFDFFSYLSVIFCKLTDPGQKSISFICVPSTTLCAAITALTIHQMLLPFLVNAGFVLWFIVLALGYLIIILWPIRKQFKLSITTAVGKSALALGLKCISALLISLVVVCYACLSGFNSGIMNWQEYSLTVATLIISILGLTLTSSVLFARVFEH